MTDYSADIIDFQSQTKAPSQVSAGVAQQAVKQGQPDLIHSPDLLSQTQNNNNAAIVQRSPHMSQWAGSHPAHVAASQDHFPWMEGIGHVFNSAKQFLFASPEERGKTHALPTGSSGFIGQMEGEGAFPAEAAGEIVKQAKSGYEALTGPFAPESGSGPVSDWIKKNYPSVDTALNVVTDPLNRIVGGAQAALSPLLGTVAAGIGKPVEQATSFRRENVPLLLGALKGLGGKIAKAPKAAGAEPPQGAPAPEAPSHPADVAEAMGTAVQNHPLTKAAPDTMKEFLRQQTQGTPLESTKISGASVEDLYKKAGITPHPEDGMLGWVPNLQEQMDQAKATGGDIEVPTHEYMANTNGATQSALAGGLRYGDEATRDEEAQIEPTTSKMSDLAFLGKTELEQLRQSSPSDAVTKDENTVTKEAAQEVLREHQDYKNFKTADLIDAIRRTIMEKSSEPDWINKVRNGKVAGRADLAAAFVRLKGVTNALRARGYNFAQLPEHLLDNLKEQGWDENAAKEVLGFNLENLQKTKREDESSVQPLAGDKDHIIPSIALEGLPKDVQDTVQAEVKKYFLSPLFDKAKTFNMTEPQAQAYSKLIEERTNKLVESLKAEVGRQQKAMTSDLLEKYLPAIRQELGSNPALAARHAMTYGKLPTGETVFDNLKDLNKDDVAELFGFDNGEAMDKAIKPFEDRRASLKGKVTVADHFEQMAKNIAHYKASGEAEIGSPARIEDITRDAVIGPQARTLLEHEMLILADNARAKGEEIPPFTKGAIASHASKLFDNVSVSQARNVKYWERLAFRQGQEAEVAGIKGKAKEVFEAKQRQTLTTYMLEASHKMARQYPKDIKTLKGLADSPTIASMDQEYLNHIHSLLSQAGMEVARNPTELANALKGKDPFQFMDERRAEGAEIAEGPIPKDWKNTSKGEWSDFMDMIRSLAKNGRDEKSIETILGKMAFDQVLDEAKAQFNALGRKFTPEDFRGRTIKARMAAAARGADATMLNMETMLDMFDQLDPKGIMNRVVNSPMSKALGEATDRSTKVRDDFQNFAKGMPKAWSKSWNDKISTPLKYDGEPIFLRKSDVLGAMLNLGNDINREKYLKGWNLDEKDLRKVVDQYATKADWDFVQHVWDTFETLWPQAESLYHDLAGVAPTKMQAVSVDTPFGKYKGGYWPLIPDEILTPDVGRSSAESQVYDRRFFKATPPNKYTKERTQATYPISNNFKSFPNRINQIIHDLSYRKPLRAASKLLLHPDIQKGIRETFGKEYSDQMLPWLRDVANSHTYDDRGMAWWNNAFSRFNSAVTMVGLGYRVSTAGLHGGSALMLSAGETGTVNFGKAFAKTWLRGPQQTKLMRDWIHDKSDIMKYRSQTWERDLQDHYKGLFEKQGFISALQHNAFHFVAMSDQLSAYPTWLSAYTEGSKTMTDSEAVNFADKAVRRAHGSGATQDLPAVLRSQSMKPFTLFSTFVSRMYNSDRMTYRQFKQAKSPQDLTKPLMRGLYSVLGIAMWHQFMKGPDSNNPITAFIESLGYRMIAPWPIVRDAYQAAVVPHADYQFSPLGSAIKTMFKGAKDLYGEVSGEHVSKDAVRNITESAGYFSGLAFGTPLPLGQIGQTGQYLYDFSTGKEKPEGIMDFLHGLTFGKGKKK